jgi:hypothetical protein
MNTITIHGHDAINAASAGLGQLRKYADPIDGERAVSIEEAREIAREDASLIYIIISAVQA